MADDTIGWFSRTRVLVGDAGVERLRKARVAVIGLGGVGGYAVEALARAGIGYLFLADADAVEISNMNRQILALDDTLGMLKVDAARQRVLKINPEAHVETSHDFLTPENIEAVLPAGLGYAIDAIDAVPSKVHLIAALYRRGIPFVSCMGAGNRLLPTGIEVADIGKTKNCPLARAVRRQLREHGISSGVRCVYSEENPRSAPARSQNHGPQRRVVGTIAHVPGIVGLMAAGLILNDILG